MFYYNDHQSLFYLIVVITTLHCHNLFFAIKLILSSLKISQLLSLIKVMHTITTLFIPLLLLNNRR